MKLLQYFLILPLLCSALFADSSVSEKELMESYFRALKQSDYKWLAEKTSPDGLAQIKSILTALANYAEAAGEFEAVKAMFGTDVQSADEVNSMSATDLYLALVRSSVSGQQGWNDTMNVVTFRYLGSLPDGENVRYATFVMSVPVSDGAPIEKASIVKLERDVEEWKFGLLGDLERIVKPILLKYQRKAEQAGAGQPATRPVDEPEGGDNPQHEAEGRSR